MLSGGFSSRRPPKRRRRRRPSQAASNGDGSMDGQQDLEHQDTSESLVISSAADRGGSEGQATMEALTKQTMSGISKVWF